MKYTTTCINRGYRIKVYGWIDGMKIDTLVGVSGLIKLIGVELANKFVCKAFDKNLDKFICKLRRGLKITFYLK